MSVGKVEHPRPKEPPINARRHIDLNSEVKRFMMIYIREGFGLLGVTQSLWNDGKSFKALNFGRCSIEWVGVSASMSHVSSLAKMPAGPPASVYRPRS